MGLLSIFSRQVDAASQSAQTTAVSEPADAVQRARTRARQRLIGAVVLVGIGIIGFPLVFETQPRPIAVDIPIDIPRKDGAPALAMPPARVPALPGADAGARADRPSEAAAATPAPGTLPAAARDEVITESRDEAGRERGASGSAAARAVPMPVPMPVPVPSSKPASSVATAPAQKAADHTPAATLADGARAKALLEGKEPATAVAGTPRFVVQVGAFADGAAARETRLKVEKLGLKTYTQVAETPAGSRIRVRVGPFATRTEADQARARARDAGLSAVVLTL